MYEFAIIWDWMEFAVRWLHVITAIAWIGSSFYFIALDLGLRQAPDLFIQAQLTGARVYPDILSTPAVHCLIACGRKQGYDITDCLTVLHGLVKSPGRGHCHRQNQTDNGDGHQ